MYLTLNTSENLYLIKYKDEKGIGSISQCKIRNKYIDI